MLPLDAVLLQLLMPGSVKQQDARTRQRMFSALRSTGNAYSMSFEPLRGLLATDASSILHGWWEYNLCTEYFAHKHTARLLRHGGL